MTIIEFLTARYDEDEAVAKRVEPNQAPSELRAMVMRDDGQPFLVIDSARVLADIEAKREIMELHQPTPTSTVEVDGREVEQDSFEEIVSREVNCMACAGYPEAPCRTLRLLASVFADHPDYRDEWSI